jgi:hypothetical protein
MLIYRAVRALATVLEEQKQKCRRETGAEETEFAPASPPRNVRTLSAPVYEWANRKTLSQQVSSTPSISKTSMCLPN